MKSIRLNKEIRFNIITNIKKAYLLKNPEPILASPAVLLDAEVLAYSLACSEKIEAIAKEAGLLKCIHRTHYIQYRNPSGVYSVVYNVDDSGNNAMFYSDVSDGLVFDFEDKEAKLPEVLSDAAIAFHIHNKEYKHARINLAAHTIKLDKYLEDVSNVLSGVNTTGQLIEAWPECEKYVPVGILNPSKINLPALSIAELNKVL